VVADRFGRHIHYLRISLTDHCNLRCVYCMPEDMVFRPNAEMMQDDEVLTLFRLFVGLGFDKFRLTGGEPTVRANIVEIVREMGAIPGVGEISMTTNGILLGKLAKPLSDAGLKRCNISLDTLDPERFRRITRWGKLENVWEGIQAAEKTRLLPIKLNSVIVRGVNDGQAVADLAALTLDHPWQVRFIEMMPLGGLGDFQQAQVVTEAELHSTIEAQLGPLTVLNNGKLDGEARVYKLKGAQGSLGFISSVSVPFCATCTRARLTADGRLRLCLLREKEVDLLTPLRQGATQKELLHIIRAGIWQKPWGHGLAENAIATNRQMSEIGG
jgi:cyclic pyranopterin phosphate synthase